MGIETELKLAFDPQGLRRLRRHPLVQRLKQDRPQTRQLKSVYFDTDDFRLKENQVALRVRHIGRRRIQTVKTAGANLGGAWRRDEWEMEINGDLPDPASLAALPVAAAFGTAAETQNLRPVFTTEVRRTIYLLGEADWQVELALDEGRIVSAQGSREISEAELELKAGDPARLFELALALQDGRASRVLTSSKAARGYRLAAGTAIRPQKSGTPPLRHEQTQPDAFRAIAWSCLEQLQANHECLLETGDAEAVHQMRVALRRLRSALGLFKALVTDDALPRLLEELRWLQSVLGPARDRDVLIAESLAPFAPFFSEEEAYRRLRRDMEAERQFYYGQAIAALSHPRFTHLMLSLGQWCQTGPWTGRPVPPASVGQLAARTLDKRFARTRKDLRALARLPADERHLLRIRIKKLRYATEFFESLYGGRAHRKFVAVLAALQDHLGALNDTAVALRALRGWADGAADAESWWLAGRLGGRLEAGGDALLAAAAAEALRLGRSPRFWRS
ncbi:inorganic triphosphatase [mine drainage metagenome]|uniref:Inorganic triphosphatase n=1 Tax=mine drainage metagenome TaxID=410659 RepID=A0A1J5RFC9_9ZZZZ